VWQTHVPAPFFEDWRWYGDGPARLLAGQPLYDPAFLHGPYDQADPAVFGKFNQWPALATLLVPFQGAIPGSVQALVWGTLMAAALVAAYALVWPRRLDWMTGLALALIIAVAPPTWLAFRTANLAGVVALGVALTIVGERRRSTWMMAAGVLLAGVAKLVPAVPLVLWLLVKKRQRRPVAWAVAAGVALTAIPVVMQGPRLITDFITTSAGQLPLDEWTNVAPAYRLAPLLGSSVALLASLPVAAVLVVVALRPRRSDGASLLLLTVASCLVLTTVHLFWWLSPMIVALAYYGDWIAAKLGRLFAWKPTAAESAKSAKSGQSAGASVT
jgi:glycosyl transferase family 87